MKSGLGPRESISGRTSDVINPILYEILLIFVPSSLRRFYLVLEYLVLLLLLLIYTRNTLFRITTRKNRKHCFENKLLYLFVCTNIVI